MDLAVGAKRIWLIMEHTSKDGKPRLLEKCSMPLTAPGVVKRVYTNLAVVDVTERGFELVEMNPEITFEALQARTGAKLQGAALAVKQPGIRVKSGIPSKARQKGETR